MAEAKIEILQLLLHKKFNPTQPCFVPPTPQNPTYMGMSQLFASSIRNPPSAAVGSSMSVANTQLDQSMSYGNPTYTAI